MPDDQRISAEEEVLKHVFQQEVLNRMRQYLCNHLEPERFFPYLQTKNYLDTENCDQIRSAGTTKSKVNKMLDILMRSGRQPLLALVRAIQRSGSTQKFIAKRLEDEYEDWIKRRENVLRLESVRQRQDDCPATIRYRNTYEPLPPPYSVTPFTVHTIEPSHSGPMPKTDPKSAETPPYIPVTYDRTPSPNSRSRSPGYTSYFSSYGPSDFGPSDFPQTGTFIGPPNFGGNFTNFGHAEPVSLIHQDQRNAERKIPPPLDGASAPSLHDKIMDDQHKELQKYEARTLDNATSNWPRSPRTPSEHEISSNDNFCMNNEDAATGDSRKSKSDDDRFESEKLEARSRVFKPQISCQPTSIQPSTFNYSDDSYPRSEIAESSKEGPQKRSFTNGSRTNQVMRDYASTLETIQSGEVLRSLSPINGLQHTRNPMEHTDSSMMEQCGSDCMDTLEISTE